MTTNNIYSLRNNYVYSMPTNQLFSLNFTISNQSASGIKSEIRPLICQRMHYGNLERQKRQNRFKSSSFQITAAILVLVLVLVYTQEGSLWSIVLRCDDHTGIFTCDGCARDPYFYVPAETQSYVIKLSCSRKVLAASGD